MAKYDVFLSYSRADTERVAPLRDELRKLGYKVFFDTESIEAGEQWKRRLERSIRASRALVLCWSKNFLGHEFITFEYSRAEALHKPVLPWLLDTTPLPQMLEIQGIPIADPVRVATKLKPALCWPLARRRQLQAVLAALVAIVLGLAGWRILHPPPPPPWEFKGNVYDRNSNIGIPGVEVDAYAPNNTTVEKSMLTDAQGNFDFLLPPPQPKYIHLLFRKDGYCAEQPLFVPTDKAWPMDMAKLPCN